ncbi:MAG TPA: nucleotide sugar dehydrogenase [Terriglobales bacterium]|nr:nucleotide sugar dehydrogenase [Terriglobales bacterium]
MHIGVYGSGYLATVISACLADFGTPVCCCHSDGTHILEVSKGDIPFYEKNLQEVIRRNVRSGRLTYSAEPQDLARKAQVIFLAEDSPVRLEEIVLQLAGAAGRLQVLSIVTPVKVGSTTALENKLKAAGRHSQLVCQPMFFTNGCAVEDFNWPDRIILGTPSSEAVSAIKQIFHPLVMRGVPVLVTNYETAELAREATTAFVATKISFINEIASLCEHVHADAVTLSLALGLDKKIAPRCLQPGAGMGGIFAESDMDSLTGLAVENRVDLKILNAAREVNRNLAEQLLQKVAGAIETVQNKDVGILGLAFKPHTNSVAGSASVHLAQSLLANGARVRAYDPVAMPDARLQLNGTVKYCESAYGVAEGVDALVVATGWPEFRTLDFSKIRHLVKRPIIIDTKNLLDCSRLRAMGFQILGVGRR